MGLRFRVYGFLGFQLLDLGYSVRFQRSPKATKAVIRLGPFIRPSSGFFLPSGLYNRNPMPSYENPYKARSSQWLALLPLRIFKTQLPGAWQQHSTPRPSLLGASGCGPRPSKRVRFGGFPHDLSALLWGCALRILETSESLGLPRTCSPCHERPEIQA